MPSLATNKKARFDYEFLETFEGGLVLTGPEVKSVKKGSVQLQGSFLFLRSGELWLKHAHVAKYPAAGPQPSYDPQRDRKVLMHRRELSRLIGKLETKGYTLVPVSVYTKGDKIKLEFALGRGKKQFEKRDAIKKRDVERELKARMKE
jgi:SsrA-binding protein